MRIMRDGKIQKNNVHYSLVQMPLFRLQFFVEFFVCFENCRVQVLFVFAITGKSPFEEKA
jgi:hypothetical protein